MPRRALISHLDTSTLLQFDAAAFERMGENDPERSREQSLKYLAQAISRSCLAGGQTVALSGQGAAWPTQ
eukprot:7331508-Alexandrium_andersonii.AAC.1